MERIGRKRLSMDIPAHIHGELKTLAKNKYNMTLTRYVLRLLFERIHQERRWDGTE